MHYAVSFEYSLFHCKEVDGMEIENSGIMVLDEGIEESLENLTTCCKVGPTRMTPQ